MLKTEAVELLGGSIPSAAAEIGISYQAVVKWPDVLPSRIEDRVLAALARKRGLADMICQPLPSNKDAAPPRKPLDRIPDRDR